MLRRFLTRFAPVAMLSLFLLATAAPAGATEDITFYAGGGISIPMGNFGDFASLGFGGTFGARKPHNEALTWRGELSGFFYGGESFEFAGYSADYSFSTFPLAVLAEYRFDQDQLFYGLGGLALVWRKASIDTTGTPAFGIVIDDSTTDTEFGLIAGGGYNVTPEFAVEGRLNIISDTTNLTIGGVYNF